MYFLFKRIERHGIILFSQFVKNGFDYIAALLQIIYFLQYFFTYLYNEKDRVTVHLFISFWAYINQILSAETQFKNSKQQNKKISIAGGLPNCSNVAGHTKYMRQLLFIPFRPMLPPKIAPWPHTEIHARSARPRRSPAPASLHLAGPVSLVTTAAISNKRIKGFHTFTSNCV